MKQIVKRAIGHELNDQQFLVLGIGTKPNKIHDSGVSKLGEDLDFVFGRSTIGELARIVVKIRRWVCEFGTFDGGDELAAVEDSLINSAVTAFA